MTRFALCLALCAAPALAHDPGFSSSLVEVRSASISVELTFNHRDFAGVVDVDRNRDGTIDPAELAASRAASLAFVRSVGCLADGGPPLDAVELRIEGDDVVVALEVARPDASALAYRFTGRDELPRGHRHFVAVFDGGGQPLGRALLGGRRDVLKLDVDGVRTGGERAIAVEFFGLGVEHILIGYDHILFLLALLLAAPGLLSSVRLITAFTVGHSVTLIAAALEFVHLPGLLVESVIAFSVLLVAVQNFAVRAPKHRWKTTFAFGLVHGFGFASVLRELGLGDASQVVTPLLSFNVGVEVGQIAIAAATIPLLVRARRAEWFATIAQPGFNALIAVCGAYWLVDRVFGG